MQSKATTVEKYLSEMPEERRAAIATVRHVILKNLDKEFEEGMQYGMIGYYVPHHVYPAGYHCDPKQPLPFASLASQKDHMSLYLMPIYAGAEEDSFRSEWAKSGKKLDMGKSCIRFKKLEDLALNVIGDTIRRLSARKWIECYEAVFKKSRSKSSKPAASKEATKAAAKSAPSTKQKVAAANSATTKAVAKKSAKTSKPQPAKKVVKKIVKKVAAKQAAPKKKAKKK